MKTVPNTLARRGGANTMKTMTSSRVYKTRSLQNTRARRHDKDTSQTPKPRAGSESVEDCVSPTNEQAAVQVEGQSSVAPKPSPFSDFLRPTPRECKTAHDILEGLHSDAVREILTAPDAPAEDYPYAMDALVVAALSQATSWSNARRAMQSMKEIYGSPFAYSSIVKGGTDKLVDALRPGGMQNRKAKILMTLLKDVKAKHGKWDLQHLFTKSDDEVIAEVTKFWGIGPKCAHCLLSICLKRDVFAVDTHVYRLSGLWGWRPAIATKLTAQAHLDARIPNELKFPLHYLMIAHGSSCPKCRGNGNPRGRCEFEEHLNRNR
ncbi:hypothetical protein NW759_006034 [Fusarium solani]|nr:hypothetical protein NW759_006034 [Fusarium solani]